MRSLTNGTILALLLVPTLVWSAEPKINGPEKIEEGKLLRLSISDLPKNATVEWESDSLDFDGTDDGKFVGTGLRGPHKIVGRVFTLEGDRVRTKRLTHVVTIGEAKKDVPPPIPPNPNPNPPQPNELSPDAWFMVIEETQERTSDIASMLEFSFWDSLPLKTGHWHHFDQNSKTAQDKGYLDKAKAEIIKSNGTLKYPLILAIKQSGPLIESRNLGTDRADIRKWVNKITGLPDPVKSSCVNGVCK